jgi:hypothetical protein
MRTLLFAVITVFSLLICNAQAADDKPIEPIIVGQIYLLDASAHGLNPLPEEKSKQTTEITGVNSPTRVSVVRIAGARSSFRIKAGSKAEFVFKIASPDSVSLYELSGKRNREAAYEKVNVLRGAVQRIPGMPVKTTPYGQSYKLVPTGQLPRGEYLIYTGTNAFTFGID